MTVRAQNKRAEKQSEKASGELAGSSIHRREASGDASPSLTRAVVCCAYRECAGALGDIDRRGWWRRRWRWLSIQNVAGQRVRPERGVLAGSEEIS